MRFSSFAVAVAALAASVADAASKFSPARPPAIPLAVRSPYLNTWLNAGRDGGNGGYLAGQWPVFWTQSITGWQGFISVDGKPFTWMGAAPGAKLVDQVEFSYTSTRSIFTMHVDGKVEMKITFMSPVYPEDMGRQGLTFSYLNVECRSLDGASHRVQLYADVSAEWASGDKGAFVKWEKGLADGVVYHKFWRSDQRIFSESADQADWGNWYWSTKDTSGVTFQSGADGAVRGAFLKNGKLPNTVDSAFRRVNDRWPVFALARDLSNVGSSSIATLFTIGYTQEKAIRFQGKGDSPQEVPSLWTAYLKELQSMTFFFHDFGYASRACDELDKKIAVDSLTAGGQDYLTITSLSVRQTFGALQFTGTYEAPLIFLKEISSNSDIQTVDVIFPASPILYYLNPFLVKYLLEPLIENQESGHYPRTSAIHDLGRFPNALGFPNGNDEPMPLEECGNMMIMMLAYTQRTGDTAYLNQHWDLIMKWTQYLLEDSKIPAEQLSTDDFAGHLVNQTNLAIKGIIGLKAVSEMAGLIGRDSTRDTLDDISQSYLEFWMDHGINQAANPPHTTLQYDKPETHGLLYNLYGDALLNLDFVPRQVYDMQSAFYPTIAQEYGVPLDTRNRWTKSDWEMFAAAVASPETQQLMIRQLARWINVTPTHRAMTDLFMVDTGDYPGGLQFTARPVMGGTFALLALKN